MGKIESSASRESAYSPPLIEKPRSTSAMLRQLESQTRQNRTDVRIKSSRTVTSH